MTIPNGHTKFEWKKIIISECLRTWIMHSIFKGLNLILNPRLSKWIYYMPIVYNIKCVCVCVCACGRIYIYIYIYWSKVKKKHLKYSYSLKHKPWLNFHASNHYWYNLLKRQHFSSLIQHIPDFDHNASYVSNIKESHHGVRFNALSCTNYFFKISSLSLSVQTIQGRGRQRAEGRKTWKKWTGVSE